MNDDELLTLGELAAALGRSVSTLHGWCASGRLVAADRRFSTGAWRPLFRWGAARALCEQSQRREPADHEPTADEVDALVAEQMLCLPPWWEKESEGERGAWSPRGPGLDREDGSMVTRLMPSATWSEPTAADLHPSTLPESIFAGFVRDVRAELARCPGATVADLSAALVLPAWAVGRVLAAIAAERRVA